MVVPEMQRRQDPESTYPSFSKAHSREAVRSAEDVVPHAEPITPDSTNLGKSKPPKAQHESPSRPSTDNSKPHAQAPPSPPLTVKDTDLRRATSDSSRKHAAVDSTSNGSSKRSADEPYKKANFSASRSSLRDAEEGKGKSPKTTSTSRPISTGTRAGFLGNMFKDKGGLASGKKAPLTTSPAKPHVRRRTSGKGSATDSDATSVPGRKHAKRPLTLISNDGDSPPSDGSRPHTPDSQTLPRPTSTRKSTPAVEILTSNSSEQKTDLDLTPIPDSTSPLPPPPPPPPPPVPLDMAPGDVPRVDYLLLNGGLPQIVTRDFSTAANPAPPQSFQQYMSPQVNAPKQIEVKPLFGPYQNLLQSYSDVLQRRGSLAVATGYKSIARRLLDRLENVFARNISSEICRCVMCSPSGRVSPGDANHDNGVSWGEVLELVSGRRELPPWPPFYLARTQEDGLGIANFDNTAAPMQKLDMDVPDEYREHYVRQSKKTKDAVQKWLASQLPDDAVSTSTTPPADVDDGTLTFAMLTYLEPQQRRTFTALLHGLDRIPDSRAPTPATPAGQQQHSPDILANAARALHRLYRLPVSPRDPECAMYLLKNPSLHSSLATLAAISSSEWDILISGRFDGFLWSGAEDGSNALPGKNAATTGGSRSTTPFSPQSSASRLPMPFASSQSERTQGPVQLDEDTEIAVLAEVEREIYLGMEALEDAFESLHSQAEQVRVRMRERGAALALRAAQTRPGAEHSSVRLGTPGPTSEAWDRLRSVGTGIHEPDKNDVQSIFGGGLLDGRSELAPDDSASNVGWREREKRSRYKKHRPGGADKGAKERRSERRTSAPLEDVDEEEPPDIVRKAKPNGSERRHRHK